MSCQYFFSECIETEKIMRPSKAPKPRKETVGVSFFKVNNRILNWMPWLSHEIEKRWDPMVITTGKKPLYKAKKYWHNSKSHTKIIQIHFFHGNKFFCKFLCTLFVPQCYPNNNPKGGWNNPILLKGFR